MLVTVLGIERLVNQVKLRNASFPMLVTLIPAALATPLISRNGFISAVLAPAAGPTRTPLETVNRTGVSAVPKLSVVSLIVIHHLSILF